jgi:hypothetical protein
MAVDGTIKFMRSDVVGKVPLPADLEVGELALNLADQSIYTKDGSGTVIKIGSANGAVVSVNTKTGAVVLDTDDIDEGTVNLYFTNSRADARVQAAIVDTATTGDTDKVWSADKLVAEFGNYVPLSQKASANGVASLDSSGKVPQSQLPSIAITETFVVDSEAEQLALNAQEGDVAIRTDISTSFIHNVGTAGTMADWTQLTSPADGVLTVNGDAGPNVVLDTDNISEGTTNLYYTDTRADARVQAVIVDTATTGDTDKVWSADKLQTEFDNKLNKVVDFGTY